MSAANPSQSSAPLQTVPIVILGTDAVLAASPATPVQLAHACLRAGFANVVPASWGDELIAAAVLRRLPNFGAGPVIQCSCPIVAHRLLTVGGDLRPVLLPLVPPPVAVARYVRSLAQPTRTRITYVGACPGAVDDSIDIRMTPDSLIAMLVERDILIEEQPHVFEAVLPPDRRRYRSQPGGVPSAEALWTELGSRTLVEVDGDDFIAEVAQLLLTGKNVLIDTSARLGCACTGALNGARHPRGAVVALEPPRSTTPVVDEQTPISLDMPVPAAPRTPVDVVAVSTTPPSSSQFVTPSGGIEAQLGNRFTPTRAHQPPLEARPSRTSGPILPRSVLSAFPVTRDVDGRSLPRAYVARRRSSPKGISFALPAEEGTTEALPLREAEPALPAAPQNTQPMPARAAASVTPVTLATPAPVEVEPRGPGLQSPVVTPETAVPVVVLPEPLVAITPSVAATPAPLLPTGSPYTAEISSAPVIRSPQQARPRPAHANATSTGDSASSDERHEALSPRRTRPEAPHPPPATWTLSRGQLVGILIAIMAIAISVSTVVAILVGRSVTASVGSQLGR